jgi:hypothetical protein
MLVAGPRAHGQEARRDPGDVFVVFSVIGTPPERQERMNEARKLYDLAVVRGWMQVPIRHDDGQNAVGGKPRDGAHRCACVRGVLRGQRRGAMAG